MSPELNFFLIMAKTQAILARRFDGRLGVFHGVGLNDFMILHHLSASENGKMRRVDLAEKIGLTASGVTRLLLPMEKIGLVARETDPQDGRVSFVTLAPGGKRLYDESLERAEQLAEEIIPAGRKKQTETMSTLLSELV